MSKGRHSSLEVHPRREEILGAIARHTPVKLIAAQFDLTVDCVYRWINAHRPAVDRELRKATRRLRKDSALASLLPKEARIYEPDLQVKIHELEVQKARLIAAQDAAIKLGDLGKIAILGDTIARNVRHSAALAEVLRLRQQTPRFSDSKEYQALRAALVAGLPSKEAIKQAEAVLDMFEAKTAPPVPDALEALY